VQRVLFLGDSITYDGHYVAEFEQFLITRFPDRLIEVINCGVPSETVSGLSEEGHADGKFPRPDLHERLGRVLEQVKPDLVFACYGMNDGIYLPLDQARFGRFQDGMRRLHVRVEQSGATIIHLTPPPFHAEPIAARLAPAGEADARRPFVDYDEVLRGYSEWLLDQRAEGWRVIDVHTPLRTALAAGRAQDPAFTFAKDGIHPDAAGHREIALTILHALAPDAAATHEVLITSDRAQTEQWQSLTTAVQKRGRILRDAWLTATGHTRPGLAAGLPLDEAQARAAELEQEIRAAAAESMKSR
jgi:lysophospholipase L1-like esterase